MNCHETRNDLSAYLDGALTWNRNDSVRSHLAGCPECAGTSQQVSAARNLMRAHGRIAPPADLVLKVKLHVSRHRSGSGAWGRVWIRLDNLLRPLALPATAGCLATMLTFGVLIQAMMKLPELSNDVPLTLSTPPRLRTTPPITFTTSEEGIWIATQVDQQGRVVDYQFLNAPRDPRQISELRHMLVFTQFEPATLFGKPTSSRTVINLRRISVKG